MVVQKNRENQLIECTRFLCSVLILFIHSGFPLPPTIGSYAVALSRFAVPFLILLSGWYVDHDGQDGRAKKKLKDTVRIALIGGCICLLWNCLNSYLKTGSFADWALIYLNRQTAINFILFNRAIFFNSVFYYFFVMVYVYCIFIGAQRMKLTKVICMITPILVAGLLYICEFTELPWYYGGNFFFLGLPLFFGGYILRNYSDKLVVLKSKEWMFITLGGLCTILERRLFGGHYIYIGVIIIAVFLLIFCINHKELKCPKCLVYAGSFLSLAIVIIHCEVRDTLRILTDFNLYMLPIIVLIISIVLSEIYEKIIRRH